MALCKPTGLTANATGSSMLNGTGMPAQPAGMWLNATAGSAQATGIWRSTTSGYVAEMPSPTTFMTLTTCSSSIDIAQKCERVRASVLQIGIFKHWSLRIEYQQLRRDSNSVAIGLEATVRVFGLTVIIACCCGGGRKKR